MILKMDVEGAEWGCILNTDSDILAKFDQIVLELHWMNEAEYLNVIPKALQKLNRTHQLVHLYGLNHGNYVEMGGHVFCNQIEVCFALRDNYEFVQDYDVNLPLVIDRPGWHLIPTVILGKWNTPFNDDCQTAKISTVLNF